MRRQQCSQVTLTRLPLPHHTPSGGDHFAFDAVNECSRVVETPPLGPSPLLSPLRSWLWRHAYQ